MKWTVERLPDLTGRTAMITGVTGGLGYECARQLARRNAHLIVTARRLEAGQQVVTRLAAEGGAGEIELIILDLAEIGTLQAAAEQLNSEHQRLDILINNAGVMATPKRTTMDGFELQMGTNHIGPFALTAWLWPLLDRSDARIVWVSSILHTMVDDIDMLSVSRIPKARRYRRWRSYGESKLANLLTAMELDRRLKDVDGAVKSVAAHPGYSSTGLTKSGPALGGRKPWTVTMDAFTKVVAQSAESGAQPLLMAATLPGLASGSYVGPTSMRQTRGRPGLVGMSRAARNPELARRLWAASEAAIGSSFDV